VFTNTDIVITKIVIKFWETLLECLFSRILKALLQICFAGQLKQWKVIFYNILFNLCPKGGGIIIILFNTMTSLKQLYTISMDVHQR
jgi:hypothetical protein